MGEWTINLAPIASVGLDLEQYFGLWSVNEIRFGAMLERIGAMDLSAHVAAAIGRSVGDVRTGDAARDEVLIKVIDISGTMTKRGSSMSGAGSSVRLREAVRQAAREDSIDGILLRIDSPGGTVAGTADLANEVAAAVGSKPTWAFVEDVAASAAYWVASQCSKIVANGATAEVGSIGTFMALYDVSGAAAMQGIKAVVIRSGSFKGAGFPGTEITQEQRSLWQDLVDKTQQEFTAGVMSGRRMTAEQVSALADGRVWLAKDAISNGLIDSIGSFDSVLNDMAAEVRQRKSKQKRSARMAEESKTPQAASYAEIKAACVGSDPAFICSQLESGTTIEAATRAWMGEQQKRLDAANQAAADAIKQAADAKAEAEKAKATGGKLGVDMLGNGKGKSAGGDGGDAVEAWNAAVKEAMAGGVTKAKAVRSVVIANPQLHQDYIAAINAG